MSETDSSESTTSRSTRRRGCFARNWPAPDVDDGKAIPDFYETL